MARSAARLRTVFLPIPEWLPDQPDYQNPGAAVVTNLLPRTAQSYEPIGAPVAYSSALTARCQGCYAVQDTGLASQVFAGDASKLYLLTTASSPNFTDVSKIGGYVTIAVPDGFWSMTSFGQRVVATNFADPVQSYLVGTNTKFSDLAAAAPKAKFCAVVRDFLMLGFTNDGVNGLQPQRLWWSAIGDPTNWPTPGSNTAISVQSDYQDLQQTDLGPIQGLVGGHLSSADFAAFCERGIWRGVYQQGPIFDISVAEGAAGTLSPLSIVESRLATPAGTRSVVFYVGSDLGFYAFDGTASVPIGEGKVNRFFAADLDQNYVGSIEAVADPTSPYVYFFYSAAGSGGLYNRALAFNRLLPSGTGSPGRFSYLNLTDHPLESAARSLTLGVTEEGLDAFSASIDSLAFSTDSRVWIGGKPNLAVFDSTHKLGYLSGSNLAVTAQTSESPMSALGRRGKILSVRPQIDGGTPSVAIGVRDRLVDPVSYGSPVAIDSIGNCPQRVTGRYGRAQITLPAGSSFTHLQGVEATVSPEGLR